MVQKYWQLLFDAAEAMQDCAVTRCNAKLDKVTLAQKKIFRVVFNHPQGLKLKEIASELQLTPGAVSQSIDQMVREGFIERVTNPDDRRAVTIRPSAKSEHYRSINQKNFSGIMEDVMRECDRSEREAFVKVTEKILVKAREARTRMKTECDADDEMEESV